MKKLLIAASATACALGAFAASFTDTKATFESLDVDAALDVTKDDLGNPVGTTGTSAQWYTADAAGLETKVAAYETPANGNNKYLNIESTSKPLYRLVHGMVTPDLDPDEDKKADMGEVYIDTLVQFTAGDPEMAAEEAGAKLALWVCGNDADGNPAATTNFMVKAGCFVDGEFKSATYTMLPATDMTFEKDAWYRLTVKTIANVGSDSEGRTYPGFVVFVDGVALKPQGYTIPDTLTGGSYDSRYADAIVLSMVRNSDKLVAVGFSGTGAIDDVAFTSTAPDFAADAQKFTLAWGAGVASVTYGDFTTNVTEAGSVQLDIVKDATVTATWAAGYMEGTATGSIVAGQTYTVVADAVACYVDGTPYASFDAALAAANGKTVKLNGTLSNSDGMTVIGAAGAVELTLDLAGNTIENAIGVYEGSKLTITNSTEAVGYVNGALMNMGTLVLAGGKYLATDEGELNAENSTEAPTITTCGTLKAVVENDKTYLQVVLASEEPTVTPVKPGEDSVEVEAESAEEAAAQVEITVPDNVAEKLTEEEEVAYKANFEKKVVASGDGKFTVEVVLTKAAEEAAQADADEAPAVALPAVVAAEGDAEVEIEGVVNGFFYSVESGTTLDHMSEGDRVMAKGGKVTLTFPKGSNDKARFYKVKVNLGPKQN